jgi:hypothetical protein
LQEGIGSGGNANEGHRRHDRQAVQVACPR